jgi:hypothetical protein
MTAITPPITEEMLLAYADGELDEVNRRRVERALAQDTALAARLAAHQRVAAALGLAFGPVAQEAVPERFHALLGDAARVVPMVSERRPARWMPIALAASLALGVVVGRGLNGSDTSVDMRDGQMIARGPLARALETQLAAAQPADAATRIGLSFRAKDGQWCRSFAGVSLSGVACRSSGEWQIEAALPGQGQGADARADYRQASSGDPRVIATVEALMADAPVDAVAEKAARDAHWTR